MVHHVEHGSALESSKFLEVEDDANPIHSRKGPNKSLEWVSSIFGFPPSSESDDDASSDPYAFCQCEDEDTLLECNTYGSFFELDTHCLRC